MDVRQLVAERIEEQLQYLEQCSVLEIANYLATYGIKGTPLQCGSCPLAEKLNGAIAAVDPGRIFRVRVHPDGVELVRADNQNLIVGYWALPEEAKEFIRTFDMMGRVYRQFSDEDQKHLRQLIVARLPNAEGEQYAALARMLEELQ